MTLPPLHQTLRLRITDSAAVGEARRQATAMAQALGFGDTAVGKVALVVTECGTNLVKHAQEGDILLRALRVRDVHGLEVVAIDKGPGMRDVAMCMEDGYSSRGTAGNGLGSIQRMSHVFDVYSRPDQGTAVLAELWASSRAPQLEACVAIGAVCIAKDGESVCGDGWSVEASPTRALLMLCDGLGHGQGAADATSRALDVVARHASEHPGGLVDTLHAALRSTRGAAIVVSELDPAGRRLRFCGVGNCSANVSDERGAHGLVSQNGTVGSSLPRKQELAYAWPSEALLVMHSDGLSARFRLDDYPGLARRHPTLIAAVLSRDFGRSRDDMTVLVVRDTSAAVSSTAEVRT